jgi:tetratricopeptide (TPR) repeat protein
MAKAQTISSDVIKRLNALAEADGEVNELQLASIRRDIDALKSRDGAAGLMAYGVYHALLWESEKSIDFHERSIKACGGKAIFYSNYAVSMKHISHFFRAFDGYANAARKDPANKNYIEKLSNLAFYTGNFSEFFELLQTYLKATQDESFMKESEDIAANFGIIKDLARLEIAEADYQYAFKKVERILQANKLRIDEAEAYLLNSEGHDYLSIDVKVRCPSEKLAKLNSELADLVAEDIDFPLWNKIIHTFTYSPGLPNGNHLSAA